MTAGQDTKPPTYWSSAIVNKLELCRAIVDRLLVQLCRAIVDRLELQFNAKLW